MKIIAMKPLASRRRAKLVVISMALAVLTGCASADQRMASRSDYRSKQVAAIAAQAEQETARRAADAQAKSEMWRALSDAIESNPDSASHFAIVMAVAAARGSVDDGKSPATATLKTEREVLAIDYVKALAPSLIGTLGNVGTAAILADQAKESIKANRDVRIVEAGVEGRVYDVLGAAVSGNAYVPADTTDTTTPDTTTDTTPDTTTPADDVVDPADDVVDPSEDVDDTESAPQFDCSTPAFSPVSPERAAACP
jgi:hypothetical protein